MMPTLVGLPPVVNAGAAQKLRDFYGGSRFVLFEIEALSHTNCYNARTDPKLLYLLKRGPMVS